MYSLVCLALLGPVVQLTIRDSVGGEADSPARHD